MLKMGLPLETVQHRMRRDGVNTDILNMDPNKPLPTTTTTEAAAVGASGVVVREKRILRKRLHWQPISPKQLSENSIWNNNNSSNSNNKSASDGDDGVVVAGGVEVDVKEFEELFVSTESPTATTHARSKKGTSCLHYERVCVCVFVLLLYEHFYSDAVNERKNEVVIVFDVFVHFEMWLCLQVLLQVLL